MTAIPNRSPPWSLEAELCVLGAALTDERALSEAARILEPEDFYRESHRRIYRHALVLWQAGRPADPVTVVDRLRTAGELESVGGMDYIADVVEVAVVGAAREYAQVVADHASLRRIVDSASETIREAMSGEMPPEDVLSAAHARLLQARRQTGAGYVLVKHDIMAVMEAIEEEVVRGRPPGIPTGIPSIDRMTRGLQAGELTVLGARPSMGKTALALQVALRFARSSHRVLLASLEMTRVKLLRRGLVHLSRTPAAVESYTREGAAKLSGAAEELSRLPLLIDERPGRTMDQLRAGIHRAAAEGRPSLVVVDYLQLLEGRSTGRAENRVQEVSQISRGLKLLAGEMGCHVLALSQLSRNVEHRSPPKPVLSDLRDSGSVEQDADNVLLLWRPEYYFDERTSDEARNNWQGRAELILAKQRDGATGRVQLLWDAPTTTFTEEEFRR